MRIYLAIITVALASCQPDHRETEPISNDAVDIWASTDELADPPTSETEASEAPREVAISGAHGFDVKDRYPVAWESWRAALQNLRFADAGWLYDLKGTADPITEITVGGIRYHRAWVCEPHNCGNNQTTILIAPDQSRVVGLVQVTDAITQASTRTPVGNPSSGELACLTRLMNDISEDRC